MGVVIGVQRHSLLEPLDGWGDLDLPLLNSLLPELCGDLLGAGIDHMGFEPLRVGDEYLLEELLEVGKGDLRDSIDLKLLSCELVTMLDDLAPEDFGLV